MKNQQRNDNSVQDAITAGISATSKDPFKTAFKITLGIGLARFVMFVGVVSVITLVVMLVKGS